MILILNGILNLERHPFEIQTNSCHFVKKHLKSRQKHLDFEWSSFQMVGTIAVAISWIFKIRLFKIQSSKKSRFWMFLDFELSIPIPQNYVWYWEESRLWAFSKLKMGYLLGIGETSLPGLFFKDQRSADHSPLIGNGVWSHWTIGIFLEIRQELEKDFNSKLM